ncbi:hypothetical protein llap_17614 [Limosa lapponica baueri]|uniref:Catenin alpha-3 n=1 Tax=Limosa lapponica baueri TaxID=1758121 RepID=A0A2I0TE76_LIMLA|nr:hypothetical protein llap_17614 [Limosa lapponica baueri]
MHVYNSRQVVFLSPEVKCLTEEEMPDTAIGEDGNLDSYAAKNLIILDPLVVNEEKIRPSLEKRLEAIISGAALLADSSCTRDFHRERIIAECNAIRQALQDLLSEYINNVGGEGQVGPTADLFHFL